MGMHSNMSDFEQRLTDLAQQLDARTAAINAQVATLGNRIMERLDAIEGKNSSFNHASPPKRGKQRIQALRSGAPPMRWTGTVATRGEAVQVSAIAPARVPGCLAK